MAAINPTSLTWVDPTAREDGSAFDASEFMAYELGVSDGVGEPVAMLALPTAYGVGMSPIPDAVRDRRGVPQWIHLRTLDTQGLISAWSNGVEVRFIGRPLPPATVGV